MSTLGPKTSLRVRIVRYDYENSAEAKVTNVKMCVPVSATVSSLRSFMASNVEQPVDALKLIFDNQIMDDSRTLAEHGIAGSSPTSPLASNVAEILVLFNAPGNE